jgi:hypothetical protein
VAQPCAPADAPGEESAAPRCTGTLAGSRPSGCPLRALMQPMPGSGRWRRTAARLALCRSRAASPVSTGGNRSCTEGRPGTHAYRRLGASPGCVGVGTWRAQIVRFCAVGDVSAAVLVPAGWLTKAVIAGRYLRRLPAVARLACAWCLALACRLVVSLLSGRGVLVSLCTASHSLCEPFWRGV